MHEKIPGTERKKRVPRLFAAMFASALVIAGCTDGTATPPDVETAGEVPTDIATPSLTCSNYGEAVNVAKEFLKSHESDQVSQPTGWERAVVIKTLYDPDANVWQGTLILADGSVRVLDAGRESGSDNTDLKMASYVNVGDYIAFDNNDDDYTVPAPHSSGQSEQLRFLGHGVTACDPPASYFAFKP